VRRASSPVRLQEWLAVGDLRSDGLAREVAGLVLGNPSMFDDLLHALREGSDAVRGHAADAVERVSRERADLLKPKLKNLALQARRDPVPMVRWHLAMVFGNLGGSGQSIHISTGTLLALLGDRSPFVKSWAISGLCQIGRRMPAERGRILTAISPLTKDPSIAVRNRASRALRLLLDSTERLPAGWVKQRE
jgi:HEAT repeat protein